MGWSWVSRQGSGELVKVVVKNIPRKGNNKCKSIRIEAVGGEIKILDRIDDFLENVYLQKISQEIAWLT